MIEFGLVTEGISDQIIIDNILAGYFGDDNISVNPLQPSIDQTDINRMEKGGGWTLVFTYCASDDFKQALQSNDYLIVHIDTDVCENTGYNVCKRNAEGAELTPDELIQKVIERIESEIDTDFYETYSHRIIFAIAVDSTECWLLPLYYENNKKAKTPNCLTTLNQALNSVEGFTISKKEPDYYRKISGKYNNSKLLMEKYMENPSLRIFIEDIMNRFGVR